MKKLILLSLAFLAWQTTALADGAEHSWPNWRGPIHTGVSPHGDPPTTWSEKENVRFKVEIPGRGLASPIVWDDRIFLLTTIAGDDSAYEASQEAAAEAMKKREWPPKVQPVKQRFVVMALSRQDGSVLWQKTAIEQVPSESHYPDSSWASGSPITDGERLFAHFGSNGLFAYDLDGNLLWQKDLGDMTTRSGFGEGSSPALHGDWLIVNWDHEDESFIVGLDAKTGEERWRTARPDEVTSWATPLVVSLGDKAQVVVPGTGFSRGYDLKNGTELWKLSGMTVNVIPSPVELDGVVYLTSGYRGNMLQAVALERAHGEIATEAKEGSALLWSHDRHTPYVPSVLLYDDQLYFLKHFKSILSCLDAASGKVIYTEERLPGLTNVYASPVGAAGRVYIVGRDGKAVVFKHGKTLEILAENVLDDGFDATPAIVGDEILLRGRRYLYSLAADKPPVPPPAAKGR